MAYPKRDDEQLRLAKVGLAALIDEATGAQSVRGAGQLRAKYEKLGGERNTFDMAVEAGVEDRYELPEA